LQSADHFQQQQVGPVSFFNVDFLVGYNRFQLGFTTQIFTDINIFEKRKGCSIGIEPVSKNQRFSLKNVSFRKNAEYTSQNPASQQAICSK
jgi:hypothetical protein